MKKSQRFFNQGEYLILACLELIYAWNGFKIIAKKYENSERMYRLTEREIKRLEAIPGNFGIIPRVT